MTNHSFRFSHLEILLNVQKAKSYVQVDPSIHCLYTTERPFSRYTIYIRMQVSKGAQAGMHRKNFEAQALEVSPLNTHNISK